MRAFFWMKLRSKNVIPGDYRNKFDTVFRGTGGESPVVRINVVTVYKIKPAAVLYILPQRMHLLL